MTVRHCYENRCPSRIKTNARWVVGTMDYDRWAMSGNCLTVANAQLAVSDPVKHPEFAGNVETVTVNLSPARLTGPRLFVGVRAAP